MAQAPPCFGAQSPAPHTYPSSTRKSDAPLTVPCTHFQQQQGVGIRAHELLKIAETLFSHFQILSLYYHVQNVLPAQCQMCHFAFSKFSSSPLYFNTVTSVFLSGLLFIFFKKSSEG